MDTRCDLICLECKKPSTNYYGRYRDGFTCCRACDEAHEAKLLKEFNEWLENGGGQNLP